jgi:hypothetical protein
MGGEVKMNARVTVEDSTAQRITTEDGRAMTQRQLMSLVFDVSMLAATTERIKVQVFAMAMANGVDPVEAQPSDGN